METAFPSSTRLVAPRAELNYLDSQSAPISPTATAHDAYRRMTANQSAPLRAAFFVRDKISRLFGVEEISGFSGATPAVPPAVGDKLDFFTVESITDQQLVLTSRDSHLEVMLSVDIDASRVFVTASVKTKNLFGRAYMVPVAIAHKGIVASSLRKVSA
jgi:hypothetical protein